VRLPQAAKNPVLRNIQTTEFSDQAGDFMAFRTSEKHEQESGATIVDSQYIRLTLAA
jgi:hypothetical protein